MLTHIFVTEWQRLRVNFILSSWVISLCRLYGQQLANCIMALQRFLTGRFSAFSKLQVCNIASFCSLHGHFWITKSLWRNCCGTVEGMELDISFLWSFRHMLETWTDMAPRHRAKTTPLGKLVQFRVLELCEACLLLPGVRIVGVILNLRMQRVKSCTTVMNLESQQLWKSAPSTNTLPKVSTLTTLCATWD